MSPKTPTEKPKRQSPKARKRRVLTREKVLDAAVNLANDVGINGLSMRKLAQAVGVEAMSLYNHVKNKDDLLDAMVEQVFAQITVPRVGGDWRDEMRVRALSAHAVLKRNPWAAMQIMSRVNVGPAALAYVDATIGCLRQAGFSYPLADHAWNALDSYIYGFTLLELNFPLEPDEYADVADDFMPSMPPDLYPHLLGMSQAVMEGKHDGLHTLEFGLELLLDGLERLSTGA